jgi:hypothetical protein
MLLEMKNVAAMPVDEIRDGRIQALAIRALQQKNGAIFQGRAPKFAIILLDLRSVGIR